VISLISCQDGISNLQLEERTMHGEADGALRRGAGIFLNTKV